MDEKVKMVGILLLALAPAILLAEYTPKELCIIGWGIEDNQLLIEPEELIYGSDDSGEVEYHAGHGPTQGFVDSNENIFIVSRYFAQLKYFDRQGNLLLNKSDLETGICSAKPYDAYLDSSSHFYLSIRPPLNYIPVADLQGNLIDRLFPYADTTKKIYRLYYDISGELFFWSKGDSAYVSYNQGQFKTIDNTCMRANNGYLYTVWDCIQENPYAIKIIRYDSPDRTDPPLSKEIKFVEIPGDTVYLGPMLIGGDGSKLYILAAHKNDPNTYIYEIGLDYKIYDQISMPNPSDKYPRTMPPFVDRQGHVYEFRFMDDGLHVIKWTKK